MASILKIKNIIINKVLHHIITTHTKKETHSTIIIALYIIITSHITHTHTHLHTLTGWLAVFFILFFVYNMASTKNINFCNQYIIFMGFSSSNTSSSHLISHTHTYIGLFNHNRDYHPQYQQKINNSYKTHLIHV